MFVVTLTERTPTRPKEKDVNVLTLRFDSMFGVIEWLGDCEMNFTCWVNVNITWIPED